LAQSQKQNEANQGTPNTMSQTGKLSNEPGAPDFDDRQRARQAQENAESLPERRQELAREISDKLGSGGTTAGKQGK
jgi:hypothetical protein